MSGSVMLHASDLHSRLRLSFSSSISISWGVVMLTPIELALTATHKTTLVKTRKLTTQWANMEVANGFTRNSYWGNHSQWVCCNQEISYKMMLNNSSQEPKMSREFKDLKRCITTKPHRSDQCLMKSPYTERNIWMRKYSLSVLVEHCSWPMLPEDH